MMLQTVLDSTVAAVPLAFRNEDLDAIGEMGKGVEAMVYPYFNRELANRLDMKSVVGLGSGRISSDRKEEIDCLVVNDNGLTVAIELKGPSTKGVLLAGAEGDISVRFADISVAKKLKSELHDIYNQRRGNFYFDTTIGDILKLANLVDEGAVQEGHAVGLLKFTHSTRSQQGAYVDFLQKMVDAIARTADGMSFDVASGESEGMNVLVSVVCIRYANSGSKAL